MKVKKQIVDVNGIHTSRWVNTDGNDGESSRLTAVPITPPTAISPTVEFGFDDDDTYPFIYGDCHMMAGYLRDNYGLPVVTVMGSFSDEEYLEGQEWAHILNELPNGLLVDVRGTHTEDDVLASWGGERLVDGDEHIEMSFPKYGEDPDGMGDEMMSRLGITRL